MPGTDNSERIAIVGVGGIFPGAPDLDTFWKNIAAGVDSGRHVPSGRWYLSPEKAYAPWPPRPDRVYSTWGCFIEGFTLDPDGLNLDADLLSRLDPMFHLGLHAARAAYRNAKQLAGVDHSRVGVILGNIALPTESTSAICRDILGRTFVEKLINTAANAAGRMPDDESSSSPRMTESARQDAAARLKASLRRSDWHPLNRFAAGLPSSLIAQGLGLGGIAFTLDAACASSLYSLKFASEELLAHRADAMLAGGMSRPDCQYTQMGFSQLQALSRHGRCAPLSSAADGLVVGEGAGVFVLKRLSDAVAQADRIYGIIAGIGLSNDRGANLLAPHSEGQLRAMRSAYQQAGWKPGDVDLIECHATGTSVGDAVEISSLHQLWEHEAARPGQCVIGGVKSNVGHLLTGAGAAGLMKVLYALRHQTLPPTANFQQPAEKLASPDSPFRVLSHSEPWPRRNTGKESWSGSVVPRRATINAFGFGGINAHVLIEEWNGAIGVGSPSAQPPFSNQSQPPIAIVGLDAHVGSWDSKRAVQVSRFQGKAFDSIEANWWGVERAEWFQREVAPTTTPSAMPIGGVIQEVRLPIGQFRIPPLEMQDMLPQQQLMLKVAAAALRDAATPGISSSPDRTGVFVGIELDPNTTNFHFRWSIEQDFDHWASLLGLELSADEAEEWIKSLKDSAGPSLTPNRVMGNLGGIVASRLAREFDIGGPSFTVSCGGGSDVIAMHLAAGALERGELDQAIVGGVELSTDPRWHAFPGSTSLSRGDDSACSRQNAVTFPAGTADASDAIVLRRLSDAVRDQHRCYAVIQLAESIEHSRVSCLIQQVSTSQFPETGCANVAGNLHLPALSVFQGMSCDSASAEPSVEYAESITGLVSIVPRRRSDRLRQPVFHHHDRSVPHFDVEEVDVRRGSHVRRGSPDPAGPLPGSPDPSEQNAEPARNTAEVDRHRPLGELPLGLFVVDGDSRHELAANLEELNQIVSDPGTIEQLAVRWYHRRPPRAERRLALTMVSRSPDDLRSQLQVGRAHLQQSGSLEEPLTKRMFLTPDSHSRGGRIAFVFPGSGNAFRRMGRTLLTVFPEVLRRQQSENEDLPGQFRGGPFLSDGATTVTDVDHKSMIFSQVAIGAAICDLLALFGVRPSASIGYSLGESAALFGLRAWTERDEMLQRMHRSSLFGADLVEPFDAARRTWNLPEGTTVPWLSGIIDRSADEVRQGIRQIAAASRSAPRLYLLIVNTPRQCVVGGDRSDVERLARDLNAKFVPLPSPSTVHCEVLRQVEHAYRELHLMQTSVPVVESEQGAKPIDFYSTAWGGKYELSRETAAQAIVAQAVDTIDFPRVIEQAYADGVRLFVEIGPGSSCTKMIDEILGERPHMARAALPGTSRPIEAFLELLAALIAERVPVDLSYLYRWHAAEGTLDKQTPTQREVVTRVGGVPYEIPAPPGGWRFDPADMAPAATLEPAPHGAAPSVFEESLPALDLDLPLSLWDQFQLMNDQRTQAHEAFLRLSSRYEQLAAEQLGMLASATVANTTSELSLPTANEAERPPTEQGRWPAIAGFPSPAATIPEIPPTSLSREQCLEFAIGKIGHVLGRKFAEIDNHPTRVRLPDEPLMLVDRILTIEGEPLSMTSGRVVTEHDIHPNAWYLDCGRIPTCIAVESGQADLFLSGWLGIDLETEGLASYRLLDAVVTFHDALPQPGKTIHYDIRVLHFFRQGTTFLFRFEFDATVEGRPLLTMREGCAGFFTEAELAGGKGIIHTALDKRPRPGVRAADWSDPVPMAVESYDDRQLLALRKGDLAGCFGPAFSDLPLRNPVTLPGLADANSAAAESHDRRSRMWLIDRVLKLDPVGGKFGLGTILGELDIHPDDWFLTCHFCDDQVMPGTLMYECCLHTLRIYLLRLGWIGESGQIVYEPIPEVRSRLKCRGQVLAETKKVWYEVTLKEIGYGPPATNQRSHDQTQHADPASSAYCLADALMYADGKPIVEITDMSVRLSGLTKAAVDQLWSAGQRPPTRQVESPRYDRRPALFDTDRITAFAIGKPSDAFGDRYLPFDDERKIARLPGPPFQFLDRIVSIQNCQPWVLQAGGEIVAQYDVPPDAWYFASNRQRAMPFAVLLETALQPCGWLAAYVGSALTSETDISFRNLGGTATQFREVTAQSGTLTTTVKMTRVSNSAGMIIQHYDFDLRCDGESVYTGNTYFGFFSKAALSNQIGIRDATLYQPTAQELETARRGQYPPDAPFPDENLRMIQTIEWLLPSGGPYGKGGIAGTMPVDPASWFFKAHFYQDPVVPGSLGLESFWQLLKVYAADRWQLRSDAQFETPSVGDTSAMTPAKHEWVYRGQVVPKDRLVTVTAVIREIDDERRSLIAEGFLSVDGRVIYQMKSFSLTVATRFNSLG